MSDHSENSRQDQDPFDALPDSARLWTFGVSRPLSGHEEARLLDAVDGFLAGWKAHGHPLAAARDWRYGCFLLVAVDDRVRPPSGCSIDALVRTLKELEEEMEVSMVGGGPVWYRDEGPEGPVRRVTRGEFREAAAEGGIDDDTIVFDPTLTRLGDLRRGKWELPAGESWHARLMG